jgi:hypothetical protein
MEGPRPRLNVRKVATVVAEQASRILVELQLLLLNIRCLDATLQLCENAFAELCSVAGHFVMPPLIFAYVVFSFMLYNMC